MKCPYTYRGQDLYVAFNYKAKSDYIIIVEDDGRVIYNETHPYYDQIQVQMYFTHYNFGILVARSQINSIDIKIPKNEQWYSNLDLLRTFYYEKYLPYVFNKLK